MNTHVTEETLVAGSPDEVWSLVTEPRHFQAWYAFAGATLVAEITNGNVKLGDLTSASFPQIPFLTREPWSVLL